jgi:hypothetical protein
VSSSSSSFLGASGRVPGHESLHASAMERACALKVVALSHPHAVGVVAGGREGNKARSEPRDKIREREREQEQERVTLHVQDVTHLGMQQSVHGLAIHGNAHAHSRAYSDVRTRPEWHNGTHRTQRLIGSASEEAEGSARLTKLGEVGHGGRVDVGFECLLARPARPACVSSPPALRDAAAAALAAQQRAGSTRTVGTLNSEKRLSTSTLPQSGLGVVVM